MQIKIIVYKFYIFKFYLIVKWGINKINKCEISLIKSKINEKWNIALISLFAIYMQISNLRKSLKLC